MRRCGWALGIALVGLGVGGCERPFLARDGQLVLPQRGNRGAAVVTASGVEFHDVTNIPQPVQVRDAFEPWRAPIGFIVPASGQFTKTSTPTVVQEQAQERRLAIALRPSDTRVPSWGGEILVRLDVLAPASAGESRAGEDLAIVIDGRGVATGPLGETALGQLGGRDRVVVVDSAGVRVLVPPIPASNRTLVTGAIAHRLAAHTSGPADLHGAVVAALEALAPGATRRVLVLTDATGDGPARVAQEVTGDVPLAVVSTRGDDAAADAVRDFVPPAGMAAFGDVVVALEGLPAPSHILEASGGDARWELEGGELALGDVRAGDERTEVVRVTIPAWTPGSPYRLHATVRFHDLMGEAGEHSMDTELACTYDDDIERLAESRNGDVIAYASALATLARLDAAFLAGSVGSAPANLVPVARMHAQSLARLARDMHDPAAAAQAALLGALLGALD
jgi:hypothetical protein